MTRRLLKLAKAGKVKGVKISKKKKSTKKPTAKKKSTAKKAKT